MERTRHLVRVCVCGGGVVYSCILMPLSLSQNYISDKVPALDSGNPESNSSDCVTEGTHAAFLMSGFLFYEMEKIIISERKVQGCSNILLKPSYTIKTVKMLKIFPGT